MINKVDEGITRAALNMTEIKWYLKFLTEEIIKKFSKRKLAKTCKGLAGRTSSETHELIEILG